MKTLLIYDSLYGNTKEIAEKIYEGLSEVDKAILPVERATTQDLDGVQLLIIGSPTHGGTSKPTMLEFLKRIPKDSLKEVKIAAFDTRADITRVKGALKILMKVIGYAAPKILKSLEDKGGEPILKPEGFLVKDKEGPLLNGEIERALQWGKSIN